MLGIPFQLNLSLDAFCDSATATYENSPYATATNNVTKSYGPCLCFISVRLCRSDVTGLCLVFELALWCFSLCYRNCLTSDTLRALLLRKIEMTSTFLSSN